MGLYSNNRTSLSDVEIPALEGYNGNTGIATAMLEAAQDDLKFFDMIIARDFQEAEMNAAGYTNESEEMEAITEGALGDAWKRLVEFFKKLLAKIKAIFSSIIAKINGVIIRDNKKLVEKYKKAVLSKSLKDMKYKWAKDKSDTLDVEAVKSIYNKAKVKINTASSTEALRKYLDEIEDEILEQMYGAAVGQNSVSAGEFAKEAHNYLFDEVEEMDEGADAKKTEVMSFLTTCKKELDILSNAQKKEEKLISEEIKSYDKLASEYAKDVPGKDGSVDETKERKLAKQNALYRIGTKYQTVIMAVNRELINAAKFEIAQNRAFFTKAAAYNPKAKNESVELFDAIDEAVEFDVDTAFADYAVAE